MKNNINIQDNKKVLPIYEVTYIETIEIKDILEGVKNNMNKIISKQ